MLQLARNRKRFAGWQILFVRERLGLEPGKRDAQSGMPDHRQVPIRRLHRGVKVGGNREGHEVTRKNPIRDFSFVNLRALPG